MRKKKIAKDRKLSKKSSARASQISESEYGFQQNEVGSEMHHEGGEDINIETDLFLLVKSWWGDPTALELLSEKFIKEASINTLGLSPIWGLLKDDAVEILKQNLKKVYTDDVKIMKDESYRVKQKIHTLVMAKTMEQVSVQLLKLLNILVG